MSKFKIILLLFTLVILNKCQMTIFPDSINSNDQALFNTASTEFIASAQYFGASTAVPIYIMRYGIKMTPFLAVTTF